MTKVGIKEWDVQTNKRANCEQAALCFTEAESLESSYDLKLDIGADAEDIRTVMTGKKRARVSVVKSTVASKCDEPLLKGSPDDVSRLRHDGSAQIAVGQRHA